MKKHLTVQATAALTGLSAHTLRYYENIGLLDPVERLDNGHRRYDAAAVDRIEFLKRLRATGMPISEMQRYVDLIRAGDETVRERLAMLEAQRAGIVAQMQALQDTLDFVDMKITNYRAEISQSPGEPAAD